MDDWNPKHGRGFRNPWPVTIHGLGSLLRWKLGGAPAPWPARVPVEARPLPEAAPGCVSVSYVGHATLLVRLGERSFITDPILSERCSPVSWAGPRRHRDAAWALDAVPLPDLVLVSHDHYDHLDKPTLKALAARGAKSAATGLGNAARLRDCGLEAAELGWWDSVELGGLKVTFVPAQHFSGRTPFDRNRTLWGGFVVEGEDRKVFFAGDTGYGPHFRAVRERLGDMDLALLPIGAYEPRWFMGPVHMNPEDAVKAHLDLGAVSSVAMHWGVFRLTDEGIEAPVLELERVRNQYGLAREAFRVLPHGHSWVMG